MQIIINSKNQVKKYSSHQLKLREIQRLLDKANLLFKKDSEEELINKFNNAFFGRKFF